MTFVTTDPDWKKQVDDALATLRIAANHGHFTSAMAFAASQLVATIGQREGELYAFHSHGFLHDLPSSRAFHNTDGSVVDPADFERREDCKYCKFGLRPLAFSLIRGSACDAVMADGLGRTFYDTKDGHTKEITVAQTGKNMDELARHLKQCGNHLATCDTKILFLNGCWDLRKQQWCMPIPEDGWIRSFDIEFCPFPPTTEFEVTWQRLRWIAPTFVEFVQNAFPASIDQKRVVDWFAMFLRRKHIKNRNVTFFCGITRSGKSSLEKLIQAMIGDLSQIARENFHSFEDKFVAHELKGKFWLIGDDEAVSAASAEAVAEFKKALGGLPMPDKIKHRGDGTSFIYDCESIFSGNALPAMPDEEIASVLNRVIIFYFSKQFELNLNFEDRLVEEADAVFSVLWAYEVNSVSRFPDWGKYFHGVELWNLLAHTWRAWITASVTPKAKPYAADDFTRSIYDIAIQCIRWGEVNNVQMGQDTVLTRDFVQWMKVKEFDMEYAERWCVYADVHPPKSNDLIGAIIQKKKLEETIR